MRYWYHKRPDRWRASRHHPFARHPRRVRASSSHRLRRARGGRSCAIFVRANIKQSGARRLFTSAPDAPGHGRVSSLARRRRAIRQRRDVGTIRSHPGLRERSILARRVALNRRTPPRAATMLFSPRGLLRSDAPRRADVPPAPRTSDFPHPRRSSRRPRATPRL